MFLLSLLLQIVLVGVGLVFALLTLLDLSSLYLYWRPKRKYRSWLAVAIGSTGISLHLLVCLWTMYALLWWLPTHTYYDFVISFSTVNPALIQGLMVTFLASVLTYAIGAWVAPRDIQSSLPFFERSHTY